MSRQGPLLMRLISIIALALASGIALSALINSSQVDARATHDALSIPKASFLYRFDTMAQSFFTIPLSNDAVPIGVAVTGTSPTHVWVAEHGLDRITQVVFTNTSDYMQTSYSITSTANSGPFLITVDGSTVWFTEREANRVGRLDATTGQIDEFFGHGLPAHAGLADLNVAPDGSIWIAGQSAKRLYRLVITSTVDYAFQEFLTGVNITTTVGPFGIDVVPGFSPNSYQIAFASPEGNRIGLLTPGSQQILIAASIPPGYVPTDIVYDVARDSVWFSEPGGNAVGLSFKGTLGTAPTQITPLTRPAFMSRVSGNGMWLSQQDQVGLLAHFVYIGPGNYNFTSYPLPLAGLWPTGVALTGDNQVWVAAYRPERIYLPMLFRDSSSS